jgi:ABC-type dipeptide/oligopeptide/nickel transport system permease component
MRLQHDHERGWSVLRFLLRRAAWSLLTLLVFVTVTFFAVHLLFPFDYVAPFAIGLPPEALEEMRRARGLDRPLPIQYAGFLKTLAGGSLGESYSGEPVTRILWEQALPVTLLVFAVGAIVAYLFGSWIGRAVAWQKRRLVAGAATTAGILAYTAFPPWLVFVLLYFLAEPLFAVRGWVGLPIDSLHLWHASPWQPSQVMLRMALTLLLALVAALVVRAALRRRGWTRGTTAAALPVPLALTVGSWFALGFGREAIELLFRAGPDLSVGGGSLLLVFAAFVVLAFGEIAFVMRTSMASERSADYVLAARAKGLDEHAVRERHAAPNAVLPALSRLFASVPYILAGLIIIEREFRVAGLSTTFFAAVETVDVPLLVGTLVAVGIVVLLLRLGLEVAHAAIDPRIRVAGRTR